MRQGAQTTLIRVPVQQQPEQPRVVIDQRQFAANVFNNAAEQGRVPATPQDQQRVPATSGSQEVISRVPQRTRYGRESRPVLGTRHCDNVN